MAPFSSNVITSERRMRAFSLCTEVETTPLKHGVFKRIGVNSLVLLSMLAGKISMRALEPAWDHLNRLLSSVALMFQSPSFAERGETGERSCLRRRRSASGEERDLYSERAFHLGERAGLCGRDPDRRHAHCSSASCRILCTSHIRGRGICNNAEKFALF